MPGTTQQAGYVKVGTLVSLQVALKSQEAFVHQATAIKENTYLCLLRQEGEALQV